VEVDLPQLFAGELGRDSIILTSSSAVIVSSSFHKFEGFYFAQTSGSEEVNSRQQQCFLALLGWLAL
jgi:hypothetical protein